MDKDESFQPPIAAPPPRPRPRHDLSSKNTDSAGNNGSNNQQQFGAGQNHTAPMSPEIIDIDAQAEEDARYQAYIADRIEEEEKGEACEWHLPGMLDGTYVDPFSVPAKYLIEQEFKKVETFVEELGHLLKENKKRHDKKLSQTKSQQTPE